MNETLMNTTSSKKNGEIEIDLLKVWEAIKRFWVLLLAATIAFGLVGFLTSNYLITKKYQASVDMIVNTSSNSEVVSSDEVNSAKNLIATYSFIISGSTVLQQVIDDLNLDMTYDELASCISVEAVSDTQVFTVSAITDNLSTSKRIIQKIIAVAPTEIEEAVDAGSCKIVSDLDYSETPISPDVAKYTVAGALLGFILALAFAIFKVLSKSNIVTEKDVAEHLGVPVLGVIPLLQ